MQYRLDKRSGNSLSALGYGCMRFPRTPLGQIDMGKSEALVKRAIESGVNYFDTAYTYFGSEEALGTILQRTGLRDRVYVATKLPTGKCQTTEDFERLFSTQLGRLKTGHVDYYLMHSLSDMAEWNRLKGLGIEGWLSEKKKSGVIRQVGFSFHGVQSEFLALLDAYDWDFCQIQYNYMNVNFQAGEAGMKAAGEKGISVIVMEPLLGGKLATGLPKGAVELLKQANAEDTPAKWALRWLWDQPQVTVVLSGMSGMAQLDENIGVAETALEGCMAVREKAAIAAAVDSINEAYKVRCTGCNYCMPCPQQVNISGAFAAYNMYHAVSKFTAFQLYATGVGGFSKSKDYSPGRCVKCGACEQKCPQHIPIMSALEDVKKRMEPFWFRAAKAVMRRKER